MTHAVVGAGLGKVFTGRKMPMLFWELAAGLAVLPDIDVFAFRLGIPYGATFGHRGFTHSIGFAVIVSFAVVLLTYQRFPPFKWWTLWAFFFALVMSHGILDAFTNGGLGIGFFIPVDDTRYFFPWRPLAVPNFGAQMFLSEEGLRRFSTELIGVWLPTIVLVGAVVAYRRWKKPLSRPPQTGG
jgi:inner membrane protein